MRTPSMTFFLLALLITLLSVSFGAAEETLDITVTGRLISAELKDADLAQVLKEIEARTGVKISIDADLAGQKVNASFKEVTLEEALKTILGENYALVFQKDPGASDSHTLREVKAKSKRSGTLVDKDGVRLIEIGYGSGKDEVGKRVGGEGDFAGPKSFAVDNGGNIYVLDAVNRRIQVFSSDGKNIKSTAFITEAYPLDIALDTQKRVYIVDYLGRIYQHGHNGELKTKTSVENAKWLAIEHMRIEDNKIYIMAGATDGISGNYLIGSITNAKIITIPEEELHRIGYYFGHTGQRYKMLNFTLHKKVNIATFDQKGKLITSAPLYVRDLLTSDFVGEDEKGNFYIKTERAKKDTGVVVEVHKFSSQGKYVKSFEMSDTYQHFDPVSKPYIIANNGIYEFKPEKDKLRIRVYSTE